MAAQLILSNRLKGFQDAANDFGQTWTKLKQLKLDNERQAKADAIAQQQAEQAKLEGAQRLKLGGVNLANAEREQGRALEMDSLQNQFAQADAGSPMGPLQQGDFQAGMADPMASLKDRIRAKMFTQSGTPTETGEIKQKREDAAFQSGQLRTKAQQTAEAHASQLETEKARRGLISANTGKATADANKPKETARDLPLDVKSEVAALSTKNANKISVANQIGAYLEQFRAAKTDDDKARIGGQMLKVLNSPEGADAIGVEEAKRLGDALEYNIFDIKAGVGAKPGNLIGRDLPGFEKQVQATYDAITGSVSKNRSEVGRLMGREGAGASGSWDGAKPKTQSFTTPDEEDEYQAWKKAQGR